MVLSCELKNPQVSVASKNRVTKKRENLFLRTKAVVLFLQVSCMHFTYVSLSLSLTFSPSHPLSLKSLIMPVTFVFLSHIMRSLPLFFDFHWLSPFLRLSPNFCFSSLLCFQRLSQVSRAQSLDLFCVLLLSCVSFRFPFVFSCWDWSGFVFLRYSSVFTLRKCKNCLMNVCDDGFAWSILFFFSKGVFRVFLIILIYMILQEYFKRDLNFWNLWGPKFVVVFVEGPVQVMNGRRDGLLHMVDLLNIVTTAGNSIFL